MGDRIHIIDPDAFVNMGKEWPWCGHGHYVPLVEHPDDATCKHCLRKYEASIPKPDVCSMCQDRRATTTWGFPVCQMCADWLTRLDRDLKAEFGYSELPPERYIDRARRNIRQRRLLEASIPLASGDQETRPPAN